MSFNLTENNEKSEKELRVINQEMTEGRRKIGQLQMEINALKSKSTGGLASSDKYYLAGPTSSLHATDRPDYVMSSDQVQKVLKRHM